MLVQVSGYLLVLGEFVPGVLDVMWVKISLGGAGLVEDHSLKLKVW